MSILDYVNDELKEKYEKQSEEVWQAWKVTAKRMRELKQKELEEECETIWNNEFLVSFKLAFVNESQLIKRRELCTKWKQERYSFKTMMVTMFLL